MVKEPDDATRTAKDSALPQPVRPVAQRRAAPLQVRDRERYEVIAEHGRGGLGLVFRARDKELGRDVAIKELLKRGDLGEIRFLREALITARLEHPGIVPIHEAGRWSDGTPFYAMKLVAGRPLRDLVADSASVDERLGLLQHLIAVADAIAYAHQRRIIHRDLKPANVIIGDFGETIVIDWGLAKDLSSTEDVKAENGPYRALAASELTAAGTIVGTPAYMAPEQARGEPVDERVDVFAIGAMLWEVCTHTRVPPNDPKMRDRLLRRAAIDKDLGTIIAKALAPDPNDRYPHAGALAADLKAFQAGARIAARNYSLAAMLAHWTRRHRALSMSVAGAVLVAIVGIVLFVHNLEIERKRAEQARDELTLEHAALQLRSYPTAAKSTLATYHGADAQQLKRLRAETWGRGVATAVLQPHSDTIWFLADAGDGEILSVGEDRRIRLTRQGDSVTLATNVSTPVLTYASAKHLLAYTTAPKGVAILSIPTHTTKTIDTVTPISLAIAQDGSRLAGLDSKGLLTIWTLNPSISVLREELIPEAIDLLFATPTRLVVQQRNGIGVLAIDSYYTAYNTNLPFPLRRLDADAAHIVIGDDKGNIALLSSDLAVVSNIMACHQQIESLSFVPHSNLVAFACEDGTSGVVRYNAPGASLAIVDTFSTAGLPLFAQPDEMGRQLVAFDTSAFLYIYDIETKLVRRYDGQPAQISFVAPPTGKSGHVLVGDVNGTVRVWEPPPRDARIVLKAPGGIFGLAFSPDGRSLITNGADRTIRQVRVADGAVTEFRGHTAMVARAVFSPDGQSVLSFSIDGSVRTWRTSDGALTGTLTEHGSIVESARYIDAGHRVVSAGDDGRLLSWLPDTRKVSVLFSRPIPLMSLEVLRHSGHVVVQDAEGSIWDISPAKKIRLVRNGDGSTITMLRASADGNMIATGASTGLVVVYDTTSWNTIAATKTDGSIRQIMFDPKGRDLIVASEDGRVRAIALGRTRSLPWHDLPMVARNLAYSPDGEILAFVCGDGGSWFYDIRNDKWAYARDHSSDTFTSAFSPDGALFASSDRRGIVTIRDIAATFTITSNQH